MSAVDEYLARIPGGLGGYPEALSRASVLQAFVSRQDLDQLDVPDLIVERARGLPPSAWLPEVYAQCLYLAQREASFDSDEAYVDYARERNAELLGSRLYRTIFRILRQSGTAKMWARSWDRHHQGTTLEVRVAEPGLLDATLQMPPHLIPPLVVRCTVTALEVALRHGGAEEASSELIDMSDTLIRFQARYR